MADLPILFSAPMVRALIAGTKTQTRRIIKPQPTASGVVKLGDAEIDAAEWQVRQGRFIRINVGDRLYVREAWRAYHRYDFVAPRDLPKGRIFYEAGNSLDLDDQSVMKGKYRQAMHMPKWASRITLIVEDVRVHRLNSFDHEDARAEGVTWNGGPGTMKCPWGITGIPPLSSGFSSAENAFAALWDHINGPGAWSANPWVVAYTFRRIMANIDMIEAAA